MKLDPRLYVDLIYRREGKFGTWDPSQQIEAGDYGELDYETGRFIRDGNIYKPGIMPNIEVDYKRLAENEVHCRNLFSNCVKELNPIGINLKANLVDLVNAKLVNHFEFKSGRCAILVLPHHSITRVPDNIFKELIKFECLKGKMLVTAVVKCSGFVRYLSNEESGRIMLELGANAPGVVPGLSAGGGIDLGWKKSISSGNLQSVYNPGSLYTPLFEAKEIKKPWWKRAMRRGSIDPNEPKDDYWDDATVPWDALGDDGEEMKMHYRTGDETDSEDEDEDEDEDEEKDKDKDKEQEQDDEE